MTFGRRKVGASSTACAAAGLLNSAAAPTAPIAVEVLFKNKRRFIDLSPKSEFHEGVVRYGGQRKQRDEERSENQGLLHGVASSYLLSPICGPARVLARSCRESDQRPDVCCKRNASMRLAISSPCVSR